MAIVSKSRVDGWAELDRALAELPKQVRRRALTEGLRAGGRILKRGMQARVRHRSGLTRRSIKMATVRATRRRVGAAEVIVGPSRSRQHIARFLEYGTRFMRAFPFMRRTVDRDGAKAFGAIAPIVWRAIAKHARQAAMRAPRVPSR